MHPDLQLKHLTNSPQQTDSDVATSELNDGPTVRVTLLQGVARTDVIRQGLLAQRRMTRSEDKIVHMLVVSDLDIREPIVLTTRVLITNLHPSVIAAGLRRFIPWK